MKTREEIETRIRTLKTTLEKMEGKVIFREECIAIDAAIDHLEWVLKD